MNILTGELTHRSVPVSLGYIPLLGTKGHTCSRAFVTYYETVKSIPVSTLWLMVSVALSNAGLVSDHL